jgi:hypothetical protein
MNLTLDVVERTFAEPMTSSAKLVYMALIYHANIATGKAWPSRALLAKETGLGVTTVSKAIGELCRRSFIVRRKSQSGNKYELHNVNVPCTVGVLPTNATCTSDERQAFTEHKKEHKNKLKKEHPPHGEGENAFEEFWMAYPSNCPRKVDKAKCRAKYLKCRAEADDPAAFDATCRAALDRWKASDLWTKEGGRYIRAPLVWLNSRSWEDAPPPAKQDGAGAFRTEGYRLRLGVPQAACF